MAGILIGECQKYLRAVVILGKNAGTTTISDDFLVKFLVRADGFSSQCCKKLAALLKKSSGQSEMRDTPDSVLVRLVRSRAFEVADSNLIEFVFATKASGVELKSRIGDLSASRVREAVGDDGKIPDAEGVEDRSQPSSPQTAKEDALVQAYNHLNGLDGLAHDFLDYGGGKLLGDQADYNLLNQFIQNVQDSIQPDLAEALAYLDSFEAVRKKKWDNLRAAETEAIRSGAFMASKSSPRKEGGVISLLLGCFCGIPLWFVFSNDIANPWVLGTVATVGFVGVILFFRGIFRLMNV